MRLRPNLAGRRILIVDDDRLNVRILTSILKPDGFEIHAVHSGEDALETYEQVQPDLVLLDVTLCRGSTGFDTCRTLRTRHGAAFSAPVIFITAKSESDDVVEGLRPAVSTTFRSRSSSREVLARLRTHLHNQLLIEKQRHLVEQLSHANQAKNRLMGDGCPRPAKSPRLHPRPHRFPLRWDGRPDFRRAA